MRFLILSFNAVTILTGLMAWACGIATPIGPVESLATVLSQAQCLKRLKSSLRQSAGKRFATVLSQMS